LEAGARRFEDLLAAGLPPLVGDPGHTATLSQTKGTFPLDAWIRACYKNRRFLRYR
jgi:hypothetical protein